MSTSSSGIALDVNEFPGKRVLVTGGTKGAGKAIADRFQRGGATVIITARSAPEETTENHFIQADVSTPEGTTKVIKHILDTFKGAKFHGVFANDLPEDEAELLAATQKPLAAAIFGEPAKTAAWKTIPSWYVVSTQDNAINPDLERFMAKRMNAQTKEIKASHVGFISNASEIAKVIEAAARAN